LCALHKKRFFANFRVPPARGFAGTQAPLEQSPEFDKKKRAAAQRAFRS
jgi:hypothetical protein